MSPKSLFNIVLKILGLFFLRDFFLSIPGFLSLISVLLGFSDGGAVSPIIAGIFVIGVFGCVAYALLFRTDWVIEKLQLAEGFDEDVLAFNIHRSTVLSIAVVLIGALMIVNTLPGFLREVYLLFQEQKNSVLNAYPRADKTVMIADSAQIVTGLLLLGNVRKVVSFIDLKRRKASLEAAEIVEDENTETPADSNATGI